MSDFRFSRRLAFAAFALAQRALAQGSAPATAASVHGVVSDSVRGGVLAGAFVALLPTSREAVTDSTGTFHFDSVSPNVSYRLRVQHALIDTLGISLTSPSFTVQPGRITNFDVSVPAPSRLVTRLCTPTQLILGPAALVGFVRDPESGDVIDSLTLSLLYDESPVKKAPFLVTRVARPDAGGHYIICGLPVAMHGGRMLISRNKVELADIPLTAQDDSPLNLRSLGVTREVVRTLAAAHQRVPSGVRTVRGDARLVGRVVTKSGLPVSGAHVQMNGTRSSATTRADGSFALDSVPLGTQSLSVRKVGYTPAEAAVDVTNGRTPIVVAMADYAPTLAPVVTVARRTQDLEAVGFTRRKAHGIGVFREGDEIDKNPTDLGESLRMIPGLHIGYNANSQTSQQTVIMSSRDANECVTIIIDGVVWQDASSAIEEYVRPDEIEALEMYHSATVPGEFAVPGKSTCAVLVLWTKRRIHPAPNPP